jgi:hypothetical protein
LPWDYFVNDYLWLLGFVAVDLVRIELLKVFKPFFWAVVAYAWINISPLEQEFCVFTAGYIFDAVSNGGSPLESWLMLFTGDTVLMYMLDIIP